MMGDWPEFYGIRRSNMSQKEMWSHERFPTSFSVALINYMGSRKIPLNYVKIDDRGMCNVSTITVSEVYGCSSSGLIEAEFCFDSLYEYYTELAEGVPPSDLVLRNGRGLPLSAIEMRTSVVPDAITRNQPKELMGPEITIRTELLKKCALSIASSLVHVSKTALEILEQNMPFEIEWSDWAQTSEYTDTIVENLICLEASLCN